jgi:hypothetical protein
MGSSTPRTADALIKYGALVVKDSRVSEDDNAIFLDLLENYFAQPDEALRKDIRPEFGYQGEFEVIRRRAIASVHFTVLGPAHSPNFLSKSISKRCHLLSTLFIPSFHRHSSRRNS